jgi:putative transposase
MVLGVSSSGFYDWFERPVCQRERHNAKLLQAIKSSHEASDGTYGSPRVVRDLIDAGISWPEPPKIPSLPHPVKTVGAKLQ